MGSSASARTWRRAHERRHLQHDAQQRVLRLDARAGQEVGRETAIERRQHHGAGARRGESAHRWRRCRSRSEHRIGADGDGARARDGRRGVRCIATDASCRGAKSRHAGHRAALRDAAAPGLAVAFHAKRHGCRARRAAAWASASTHGHDGRGCDAERVEQSLREGGGEKFQRRRARRPRERARPPREGGPGPGATTAPRGATPGCAGTRPERERVDRVLGV